MRCTFATRSWIERCQTATRAENGLVGQTSRISPIRTSTRGRRAGEAARVFQAACVSRRNRASMRLPYASRITGSDRPIAPRSWTAGTWLCHIRCNMFADTAPTTGPSVGAGALTGVRVLDLSHQLAGPYSTMILADLGADVVKVEQPGGGDYSRRGAGYGRQVDGVRGYFASINRGKRSIVLDLKNPAGQTNSAGACGSGGCLRGKHERGCHRATGSGLCHDFRP